MAIGDYLTAARGYETLLSDSREKKRPQVAFFYIQAGRARLFMGQLSTAIVYFKRGLVLLSENHRYVQLYRVGQHISEELNLRGLRKESAEIKALIGSNIPAAAELPTEHIGQVRPRLPLNCPTCGGALNLDVVEWLDHDSVECPLCASSVETL